jgi:Histidine kinase-, DNA gyrase B-, and HSP90-like ATPase
MADDSTEIDSDEIEVRPTKSLFVEMLTKDIQLSRAVIDLIDNSVDGARRLRPAIDADLTGLEINLELGDKHFRIKDNCGGISTEIARKYAFRIGRPKGMPTTPNSVGQFGVGMKRSLFKFGHDFEVRSKTLDEAFTVKVNVDEWEADETSWGFKFDSIEKGLANKVEDTGTEIIVNVLRTPIASSFGLAFFRNSLARDIQAAQQNYIDRGLRIVFDGKTLIATPWQLLSGQGIEPARADFTLEAEGTAPVNIRIFAGVSSSSPTNAGWYVFCNGRMVLESDQSRITGWDVLDDGGTGIPKFHNQFARFRGFVFFDSADASLLPWNTTKTGVDEDSETFKSIRLKMIESARPIIDFLNSLDAEKDNEITERPLTAAVTRAALTPLRAVTRMGVFVRPTRAAPTGPSMTNIAFKRPTEQVDALQSALHVGTRKQVGETSFDLAFRKFVEES